MAASMIQVDSYSNGLDIDQPDPLGSVMASIINPYLLIKQPNDDVHWKAVQNMLLVARSVTPDADTLDCDQDPGAMLIVLNNLRLLIEKHAKAAKSYIFVNASHMYLCLITRDDVHIIADSQRPVYEEARLVYDHCIDLSISIDELRVCLVELQVNGLNIAKDVWKYHESSTLLATKKMVMTRFRQELISMMANVDICSDKVNKIYQEFILNSIPDAKNESFVLRPGSIQYEIGDIIKFFNGLLASYTEVFEKMEANVEDAIDTCETYIQTELVCEPYIVTLPQPPPQNIESEADCDLLECDETM